MGQGELEVALRSRLAFGTLGAGLSGGVRGLPGLGGGVCVCAPREAGSEAGAHLPSPSRALALNLLHFSLRGANEQQIANNPKYLAVHMRVVAPVCVAGVLLLLEYDI